MPDHGPQQFEPDSGGDVCESDGSVGRLRLRDFKLLSDRWPFCAAHVPRYAFYRYSTFPFVFVFSRNFFFFKFFFFFFFFSCLSSMFYCIVFSLSRHSRSLLQPDRSDCALCCQRRLL